MKPKTYLENVKKAEELLNCRGLSCDDCYFNESDGRCRLGRVDWGIGEALAKAERKNTCPHCGHKTKKEDK